MRLHAAHPADASRFHSRGCCEPFPPDIAFLARQGASVDQLKTAIRLAAIRGTTPSHELLVGGFDRATYWSLLAQDLGLAFVDDLRDARIVANVGLLATEAVRLAGSVCVRIDRAVILVVAPRPDEICLLQRHLAESPALAARVRLAMPETIRAFLVRHRHEALTHYAVNRLARVLPPLSARRLGPAKGASGATALVAAALGMALLAPVSVAKAVALLCTMFFLNCSVWKLAAALKRAHPLRVEPVFDRGLPTYTVLIPLYREAAVTADLVAHMRKLDYPALCSNSTKRNHVRSATIPRWQSRRSYPRSGASRLTYSL